MPANLPPEYFEADRRYKQASTTAEKIAALEDLITTVPKHKGTDHLRADLNNAQRKLETLSAENLALKTLEGAMPGFGAEHQAEARADARHLEERLDAFITKELVTSEPGTPRGFILRADKRPDLSRSTFKHHKNAISAGTTAIRKGAKRVRIYALVPAGQVVPGAKFKN